MKERKEKIISPTGCHDCVLRSVLVCSITNLRVKQNVWDKNFPWECPLDDNIFIIKV